MLQRDDYKDNGESARLSLAAHALRTLRAAAAKLTQVSIAECFLACMLTDGSFVHVTLSWELHYRNMKKVGHASVASTKYVSPALVQQHRLLQNVKIFCHYVVDYSASSHAAMRQLSDERHTEPLSAGQNLRLSMTEHTSEYFFLEILLFSGGNTIKYWVHHPRLPTCNNL